MKRLKSNKAQASAIPDVGLIADIRAIITQGLQRACTAVHASALVTYHMRLRNRVRRWSVQRCRMAMSGCAHFPWQGKR